MNYLELKHSGRVAKLLSWGFQEYRELESKETVYKKEDCRVYEKGLEDLTNAEWQKIKEAGRVNVSN